MAKGIKTKLKPEWEMFCQYFVSSYETFGNATRSYAKAYNIDISDKRKYGTCRTNGYRLLTNADIIARVNELLNDLVMNDTTVDQQLAFLIMQNHDYSSKVAAIREYNKLKQRITEKKEIKINAIEEILRESGLREEVDSIRGNNDRQDNEAVPSSSEGQA